MIGANFNYQFIDWQHGDIGEGFDHIGTLSAPKLLPQILQLVLQIGGT